MSKSLTEQIIGYTVARKSDNWIMDDGIDSKDKKTMLIVYPIFKSRKDCVIYAKDTYNYNNPLYPEVKLNYVKQFKIIKVLITKII